MWFEAAADLGVRAVAPAAAGGVGGGDDGWLGLGFAGGPAGWAAGLGRQGPALYIAPPSGVPLGYGPESVPFFFKHYAR